jgi:PAS domain S-box-containing protein
MNIEQSSVGDLKKHWQNQIHALDQSAIVAVTDLQGVITYVNHKFCELSEYTREELVGQTHALINSSYHNATFFKDMWGTITQGKVWRGEVRNRAKSGRIYWVDTTIVPIKNDQGRVEQYTAIRYDVTDRKLAEETIERDKARLIESEKMASIGVLSAGIAHELGNPLGAIRGRLEMLETMISQGEFEKAFAIQSIQKMIQNVDRMSKIIRGLKSSSRDGSADQMQEFDLAQLIGDILELSVQKCQKSSIEVRSSGLIGPVPVFGRETEIGQVIVNLFNNAFDAVKSKDKAWIELEVINEPDKVTLHIKDSGAGVPEDLINKIFDPFFTTKEVGEGTGLGLSICRSFIEGHRGKLYYNTEKGVSCFTVELPRQVDQA